MTKTDSATISKAVDDLVSMLSPACIRLCPVGELRRKSFPLREIKLLAIPCQAWKPSDDLFQSIIEVCELDEKLRLLQNSGVLRSTSGEKLFLADYYIQVKIVRTTESAWAAMLFHHTAAMNLQIAVQTVAKGMGFVWVPEEGIFRSKSGGASIVVRSEDDVFKFTQIPHMPVEMRGGSPVFMIKDSGRKLPMSLNDARRLISESRWVDTKCGGELHQYTLRPLASCEMDFVHLVETIRTHGYDGHYLGKAYRYLDIDGFQYFTQGWEMRVTFLINRKKLYKSDKSWQRNSKVFHALTESFPMIEKAINHVS